MKWSLIHPQRRRLSAVVCKLEEPESEGNYSFRDRLIMHYSLGRLCPLPILLNHFTVAHADGLSVDTCQCALPPSFLFFYNEWFLKSWSYDSKKEGRGGGGSVRRRSSSNMLLGWLSALRSETQHCFQMNEWNHHGRQILVHAWEKYILSCYRILSCLGQHCTQLKISLSPNSLEGPITQF